jgi:signal transduction histidine kinase
MNTIDVANLVAGLVELSVVGLILWESRELGVKRPPLIWGLCIFFAIDALIPITRSELLWRQTEHFAIATALDIASLVVLMLVLANARHLTRAALATVNLAEYRAAEYERARRDYTQVVRHRVMNPVTVILGAADTLRAGALANKELTERLLVAIEDSARAIQNETLVPERRDDLERGLDALPREPS